MTTDARPAAGAHPVPVSVYLLLAAGIAAVSLAAIFIRYAQLEGLPSFLIAAGRLTVSAALLTPFVLARHWRLIRALTPRDLLLALGAGFFLAVHFATWILSLEYTTVLISVVFVTTNVLWVAVLEVLFLRVRLAPLIVIGLFVAFAGGVIIGIADPGDASVGSRPVEGALLALAGAIAMAAYLVIGRRLRAKLLLLPYIWLVYGVAALFLLALLVITRTPVTGYSAAGYLWVVIVALAPQLIGHTSFNYALRYLPATLVGIITQGEPIGAAIAAFILFGQLPLPAQIVGSLLIIAGVILASLGQSRR
jgi:drug/metabolite transporter (DMT)-like permease